MSSTFPTTEMEPRSARHPAWLLVMAAAIAPYAALKVCWLAGVMVGVPLDSEARSSGFVAANAVTLGLDLVALLIVQWLRTTGNQWRRVLPMWVALGFLAPVVIQVPIGFAASLLRYGTVVHLPGGLVEDWTYAVVYTSLFVQGAIVVSLACLTYREALREVGLSRSAPGVSRQLGCVAVPLAGGVAAAQLYEAWFAPAGWHQTEWTFDNRVGVGLQGAFALAAAVEILRRLGVRTPPTGVVGAGLGLIGTGVMFCYGLLPTIGMAAGMELGEGVPPVERMVNLSAMLAGASGFVVLSGAVTTDLTMTQTGARKTPGPRTRRASLSRGGSARATELRTAPGPAEDGGTR